MSKKKWPDFIHQDVLAYLAREQQRAAYRRLFEMRERLEIQMQKLKDLDQQLTAEGEAQ